MRRCGFDRKDKPAWVADVVVRVLHSEVGERVALVTVQAVLHLHGMPKVSKPLQLLRGRG